MIYTKCINHFLYKGNFENAKGIFQKNKGLNVSNNIALRIAKGKYIMRLDADDYLHPDALNKMYFKKN